MVAVDMFGQIEQIVGAILRNDCLRLRLASAECIHDVSDLFAVAMVRAGHRIVVRNGDQPRPEVDEGENDAFRLLGDCASSPK